MINSSQAHHLAMVINELTTNSIKHATANRDNIRINIIIEQDGAKTTVQFKDNGPGFPEEILKGDFSSSNIGFELIQGIVMKSLVGNVVFENDNGTVTTISFENEINIATRRDTV
jgi:two-component sensor histidine kinase